MQDLVDDNKYVELLLILTTAMPRASNVYVITLYDDADYSTHIQALQKVIGVENARVANRDSETTLVSYVDFEIFMEAGRPLYSGTFSKPVLRWIRARQEVKRIEQDVSV